MDPPYGISTTLGGEDTKKLYTEALIAIEKHLKDDGYICMASPHYIDMNEVVECLYNKEVNGEVLIDDTLKAAIDAYYEQYGAK